MLAIELSFPARRYHANPWGRHVNEAEIAWPPDPWRFCRALIAMWHRKVDPGQFPEAVLEQLISALSEKLPKYKLPAAVHAHTRHYMPMREGKKDKPTLIFDAFARVANGENLYMIWPELALSDEEYRLLDLLLDRLGYLGRAESWVEGRRLQTWEGALDCTPGDQSVDKETGEVFEVVKLYAPRTAEEYSRWREDFLRDFDKKDIKKSVYAQIDTTVPDSLLDAMRVETADLQKAGWSRPPAARIVHYQRPIDCLKPRYKNKPVINATDAKKFTTARFALYGKPLPRIEDAVRIGELFRVALIKKADNILKGNVPSVVSGHGLSKDNKHGHAFFLPEDADSDGYIDHLIVHAADGLDVQSRRVLDNLSRLWTREGHEWQVLLENIGEAKIFATDSVLIGESKTWVSATPYLHPWFAKKKFTVEDQLLRECRERGLPEIEHLERIESVEINGRERRPTHFHRFRNKHGLRQPDTHGGFWRIEFSTPVQGPLALGFGCHFGLGMFRPLSG